MIAANNRQHRSAERRGWASPLAASRARHTPAAFNKHQDRSAARGRAGFFVRRTLLHGSSSQVTEPGLRARPFSHVGWCFNTARDFLDFQALTRAGIRPDHAVARRLFDALNTAFDAAEADLDKTITRFRAGLSDGEGQGQ